MTPRLKKQVLCPSYKGNRRKADPPVIIIIECPGCGFRTQPDKAEKSEMEYVLHLDNVHHGALECAYCPKEQSRGLRLMPTFETLASHVHRFHADVKLPDGRTIGDVDPVALPPGAFNYIDGAGVLRHAPTSKEESDMALPRPVSTGGAAPTAPGKVTNWLRDEDVTSTPQPAKIIDIRHDESGRVAVIVKLQLKAGIRLDSLKANNPNFKILFEAFGEDEKNWKGKTVNVFLEYDDFSMRNWRRYSVTEESNGKRK